MHFKDNLNNIYYFDSYQQMEKFNPGLVEISETVKDDLLKPTAEQLKEKRIAEIKTRLKEIDLESIRPLRAIAAGSAVQADTDKINALDAERGTLATELDGLNV